MNMFKRSLSMFLALCMVFSMVPFHAFADEGAVQPDQAVVSPVADEDTNLDPVAQNDAPVTDPETDPANNPEKTSVEETVQEKGSDQEEKSDSENTQNPGSADTQNPGSEDTQNPGSEDTQNPGSEHTQNPGSEDTQNPGSDDTQNPGSEDTQNPGSEDTQNPGSEDTQNPGSEDTQNPGSEDAKNPGSEDTQESASETTREKSVGFALTKNSEDEIAVAAIKMGTKPVDGATTGEPFPKGTGGSNSFRIPALVTLSDGTLVAAADARWNTTYDGGGLDTIVARSSDNGANWNYTFANYLGDNGNEYNGASSCFIDPSLAVTSNDTIYMLCDLYPNGVALNGSKQCNPDYSTGFTADGYLKLTTVAPSTDSNNYIDSDFTHYLNNGKIYPNGSTTPVDGYTVDGKFNVYQNDTYVSNLFFSDSPYHVARTGYLYLTKSTDKGETWSEPTLLNLKNSSEMVCLVGPNGGMVTSEGVIVFPVYSYTGSAEYTGLIYSKDNGVTWQRSANLTSIDSSEADVVELGNGKLRVFFRNETTYLCYADFDLTTGSWSDFVNTRVFTNSNTELSAITYSKKVDGKQVILVSCPASANLAGSSSSDGSWRTSGRIFAGLVDPETYEMTWLDKSVAVTPVATSRLDGSNYTAAQGFFAYSCLTEQKGNGAVSILYEDSQQGWGAGKGYGYTMDFKTYSKSDLEKAFGVTFGSTTSGGDTETGGDVTITIGATLATATKNENVAALSGKKYVAYDITVKEASVTSATVVVKLNNAFADDANLVAHYIDESGAIADTINGTYETDADTFTFTATHFSTYAITETETETVTLKVGETVKKTIEGVALNGSYSDTVVDATWVGTEAATSYATATLGTTSAFNGDTINVADCLYTFTETSDGVWEITGTTSDGTTVYVYPGNSKNGTADKSAGYPHATASQLPSGLEVYVLQGAESGSVYLKSSTNVWGNPAWLQFDRDAYCWNRVENVNSAAYQTDGSLYLYRAATAGEASSTEIPGYVKVASYEDVVSGNKYLIAAPGADGKTYIAYPSTDTTTLYSQIAKVTGETVTAKATTTASTAVTITAKAAGNTSVTVGNTTYNITVTRDFKNEVTVELNVGESKTLTDITGNYEASYTSDGLNEAIAIVDVKGTSTEGGIKIEEISSITSGNTYAIRTTSDKYLTADGTETSDPAQAAKWTITYDSSQGGYIATNNGKYLTYDYSSGKFSASSESWYAEYFTVNGNTLKAYDFSVWGYTDVAEALEISVTDPVDTTEITFTGVAVGETTAYVGNTKYNISVAPAGIDAIVNIEVEIGETFTYTDTTGNHSASVTQQPNGTYATMAVTGTTNTTEKKLVPVTASTFEAGKLYVIENVRTADPNHSAYQPAHSVLTATEEYGGLVMNGPLDVATSQKWSFTPSDNMYYVKANGEYIKISDGGATMESTAQSLSFEYVAGSGWLIYYNEDRNNTSDNGDYFLSDLRGINSGEAFGYTTKNDDGNYWNIYEVVEETTSEATKVAFTGVKAGTTTAIVGNTQYNITVVAQEVDDEVMNSATGIWTVDPEVQRNEYNSIVTGKHKDLYTDDSWKAYETARQAAYKKLVEVANAQYTSQADAQAALAELTARVNELEQAAGKLVAAKTISVRYQLNGTTLDTREYKVTGTDTTLTLPSTIVVDNVSYTVETTKLNLGVDTTYDVPVTKVGALGGGFVASADIDLGLDHNNHETYCDLVNDTNTEFKKITEMTLTVGVKYDLDLATDTTGYTVEWTSGDDTIADVDENGLVTATGKGTTTIVATVKDAAGNVVEVNSIPVTVFPKGSGDRTTAIYIEEVTNTTVWCVVNGDTDAYAFEVVEGQLIYGQFDTTVSDGTKTTAISFFGDPDEAHALVYMKSTNSDDHYYLLHDDDGNLYDGTVTGKANGSYYVSGQTSGAGWWQAVGLTNNSETNTSDRWQKIKDMVRWAINQGCDGGLGFTRRKSEGNLASNLSFASDPMPRIEKTIDGVLPTSRKQADYRSYHSGMVAAVHELVYFKITVTQEVPTVWTDDAKTKGAITYSNAWVTDTILPGAYLYTKALDQADGTYDGEIAEGSRVQKDDINDELNGAWTAEQKAAGKRTFDYYLVYEIQESDIPKFWIDNIANLSYNYSSKYSKGAQAGAADAEARISVVGTAIDDVVIDFGQTFTYEGHEFTSITDGKSYTFGGLTNVHLKGVYVDGVNDDPSITQSHATAKYGDVKVTRKQKTDDDGNLLVDEKKYPLYEYTVTYTPNQILQGVDTVLLYGIGENNQEKIINGFLVYPATTVYYEEGFLFNENTSGSWNLNNAEKATAEQEFELLGMSVYDDNGMLTGKVSNKKHEYGYDPIYANNDKGLLDSYATTSTIGDTTSFTFTGTGFELYANSNKASGIVTVYNKGAVSKLYIVDTVLSAGTTGATGGQGEDATYNSLPIISETDLPHGTYTVMIRKTNDAGEPIHIDGVRIINTVKDNSVFKIDLEDAPNFYQLRDHVLHAYGVEKVTDSVYGTPAEMAGQVYNNSKGESGIILDEKVTYAASDNVQDLLDNGPKNELYLYKGQTLTFKVKTNRVMQLGLKAPKAPNGVTSAEISTTDTKGTEVETDDTPVTAKTWTGNSPVDMFTEIAPKPTDGADKTYLVTVKNTGDNVLSVTRLKICDDPNATFVPLTQEDIEGVLVNLFGQGNTDTPTTPETPDVPETPTEPETPIEPEEPEIVYADATLTVNVVDYTGKVLRTVELTANGEAGKTKIFSADEILAAAKKQIPKKYALVDESATADAEVVYGETVSVNVQIGKVATLKVTFVNLRGKKQGTATISKVQTANGYCRINVSEIKAQAPAGRRVMWFTPAYIPYGNTLKLIIPVI